jgi:D-serine dehydratase
MNPDQIQTLIATFPQLQALIDLKETTWFNPATTSLEQGLPYVGLTQADVEDAHASQPFRALSGKGLPETAASGGIIESELVAIPSMQKRLEKVYGQRISGEMLLKKDSHLPVSGSIKARGGIMKCWPMRKNWRWKPVC